MKDKNMNRKEKLEKRPYEPPRITEESEVESFSLSCPGSPGDGGFCSIQPYS